MTIAEIAELMVRRSYARKNLCIPQKFWNLPEYRPSYQHQMRLAARLARTYGTEVLTNVLLKEEWCFSLAAKTLANLFEVEKNRLEMAKLAKDIKKPVEVVDTELPLFRVEEKKKTILDE